MKKGFVIGLICTVVCTVIGLTGCNNAFAKQEYNDTGKIVQENDRYAKNSSVFNPVDGGFSLTVSEFDGRETLWKKNELTVQGVAIKVDMRIAGGYAKIIFIDGNNDLTVLAECSQDAEKTQSVTQLVYFTRGQNRLKIVGYDAKDVDLKVLFVDEP